jgi:hypothetical protein
MGGIYPWKGGMWLIQDSLPINLDFLLDPLSKSEFLSLKKRGHFWLRPEVWSIL